MVRLGLGVEGAIYPLDQQHRLIDLAQQAEAAGFDDLSIAEHVLVGNLANEQDPWSSWEPQHLELPWPEPMVTLAAMAGATQRLRFISAVVIAPLRPAGLLAKMAASLHALSRGRFVLGVSPSWHRQEYDALGVSFERRGQILEDTIGACRALWEGAPATFHSPTVNFDGMYCQPRPAPGQRIPVWFTGKFTPRLVRRVVTLGDGWMPYSVYGMTLQQKTEAITQLRQRFAEAGRDPDSLEIGDVLPPIQGSITRSLEQLPAILDAGVTTVRVPLRRLVTSPDQVPAVLHEAVSRFREAAASRPTAPRRASR
jgi:probable F420-dependent oxidoreductase